MVGHVFLGSAYLRRVEYLDCVVDMECHTCRACCSYTIYHILVYGGIYALPYGVEKGPKIFSIYSACRRLDKCRVSLYAE